MAAGLTLTPEVLRVFQDRSLEGRLEQLRLLVMAGLDGEGLLPRRAYRVLVAAFRLKHFLRCPCCDGGCSATYNLQELAWEFSCQACQWAVTLPDHVAIDAATLDQPLLEAVAAAMTPALPPAQS